KFTVSKLRIEDLAVLFFNLPESEIQEPHFKRLAVLHAIAKDLLDDDTKDIEKLWDVVDMELKEHSNDSSYLQMHSKMTIDSILKQALWSKPEDEMHW
ncbi:hypothetical protein HK098_007074, partial [Nowakowskiella sp. JEL0407]